MAEGFVQVGSDSSIRLIDNDVVQLPAGTIITNNDGTTVTLSAPAYYYRQRVVNADPVNSLAVATVTNQTGPNVNDFGLSVRMPAGQADLQTIAALLLDIDTNIAALAGTQPLLGAFPSPQSQYAMPTVGMPPSQLTPTIPRPVVSDIFGRQIIVPHGSRESIATNNITITSTTSAQTLIAAPDKNTFNEPSAVILTNTSATATEVALSDGTQTISLFAPASDMRGISLSGLIKASATGTAWTATTITSVASVKIFVLYVQNKAS